MSKDKKRRPSSSSTHDSSRRPASRGGGGRGPRGSQRSPNPTPPEKQDSTSQEDTEGMRLNKYVAHCGVCARRQAAEYIKEGLVTVNGEKVLQPGYQMQKGDVVCYKDKVIKPEVKKVYILLNKPKDYITTLNDDRGRRTVMELLKGKIKERIFPVGRLDRATTGLLLLTNDGELAEKMAHPSHKVKKVYHVVLDKSVTAADLDRIREGLELEDGLAPVNWVDYDGKGKDEVALEILFGRNRVVRRIFEHLGYEVKRLDRVYYAGLTKKDLPRGFWRHLTAKEVIMLKHFT
ncbi:MAG: rRNA pseudouridine synthase [Phaeodactylibacter sp.]|nr:rRNA pseudouridine synthase [Phaeodactylibacter sp.]